MIRCDRLTCEGLTAPYYLCYGPQSGDWTATRGAEVIDHYANLGLAIDAAHELLSSQPDRPIYIVARHEERGHIVCAMVSKPTKNTRSLTTLRPETTLPLPLAVEQYLRDRHNLRAV